ncbi:hypothetical protein N7476_004811 [Penicillium atrosanguineum]|uniref:Uncharacterized protein n=1 Tax=Penicillium atrosanguineum TaxID=1132637 RepID=A0A9W9Q0B4_9EURO|nr:hypothetical protein N7526_001894 [Penicillium atrosanguineum]KAJ5318391.1 hypothetical protein N7476_004811 [Penicillium atrosanguineum]
MASPAPRQKRRRVPLACSTCRQRKSRMEKRLADIEKKVQQLWQAQGPITSRTVDSHPTEGVAQEHQSDTMSELGEIDSSENAVDGMGAMNLTEEEESGFFGMCENHVKE